jgi:hypothetical protein
MSIQPIAAENFNRYAMRNGPSENRCLSSLSMRRANLTCGASNPARRELITSPSTQYRHALLEPKQRPLAGSDTLIAAGEFPIVAWCM